MVPGKTTQSKKNAFLQKYSQRLAERNLKSTAQREAVIKTFLDMKRHVSLEDLHQEVQKNHPTISFATVYRTVKLLVGMCLVEERKFVDVPTRYEFLTEEEHHDHLICQSCGKIIEFENLTIEELQEEVARKHNFTIIHHKMELYGYCSRCQTKFNQGK